MKRTTVSTARRNWLRDIKITRVTQNLTLYFETVVMIVRPALRLHEFVEGRVTFKGPSLVFDSRIFLFV